MVDFVLRRVSSEALATVRAARRPKLDLDRAATMPEYSSNTHATQLIHAMLVHTELAGP